MIHVQVSAFRGVKQADIALNRVALVGGHNGHGKSSLTQAVQAALTGIFSPGMNLKKNEAQILVNRDVAGQQSAAKVTFDGGASVTMNWPSCERAESGVTPQVSVFAAGVTRLTAMKDADRAATLTHYLQSEPTEDELRAELNARTVAPDAVKAVCDAVKVDGYDITEKRVREQASRTKGAWGQVTGRTWGSKIAFEWVPEGYDAFTLKVPAESLRGEIALLQEQYTLAVGAEAVSSANVAELEASAARLPEYTEQRDKVAKLVQDEAERGQQHQAKCPPPPLASGLPPQKCPHCQGEIEVTQGAVKPYTGGPSQEEVNESVRKMEEWAIEDRRLRESYGNLKAQLKTAEDNVSRAKADAEKAKSARETPKSATSSEQLQAMIASKQNHLHAVDSVAKARELARKVEDDLIIADILSADGLRKKKLASKLAEFNAELKAMCEVAGFETVFITDDLQVRYGAFPYDLRSEGEKYRVNAILQVALADRDGSPVIIMDGMDILDVSGKNGMFKLINKDATRHYLICMTAASPDKLAPLKQFGLGTTYWIENGQTKEVSDV